MIDGALLVDKPVGMSSNGALQEAKRLARAKKAGHAGTLDPLASGLLMVLFGEATKFAGPLLDADKEYLAMLELGRRTSTGDAEGEVLEERPVAVTPAQVERASRRVQIYELVSLGYEAPRLALRVRCSKGTYIRTLAEDIGAALGTGAHLAALRRSRSGDFRVEDALTVDELRAQPRERWPLLPLGALLAGFPATRLDAAAEARLRNGQALKISGLQEGLCALYGADGAVIGLGRSHPEGIVKPVRLTQAAEKPRKTL